MRERDVALWKIIIIQQQCSSYLLKTIAKRRESRIHDHTLALPSSPPHIPPPLPPPPHTLTCITMISWVVFFASAIVSFAVSIVMAMVLLSSATVCSSWSTLSDIVETLLASSCASELILVASSNTPVAFW